MRRKKHDKRMSRLRRPAGHAFDLDEEEEARREDVSPPSSGGARVRPRGGRSTIRGCIASVVWRGTRSASRRKKHDKRISRLRRPAGHAFGLEEDEA